MPKRPHKPIVDRIKILIENDSVINEYLVERTNAKLGRKCTDSEICFDYEWWQEFTTLLKSIIKELYLDIDLIDADFD